MELSLKNRVRSAFTLVELLVVIAIISMLLSILLPSLQRARGLSRRVTCLSNLRQLFIAAQVYAGNNNGSYPFAQETISGNGSYLVNCWDFMDLKSGKGKAGLLWQGESIAKIHQCPAFKGVANWAGNPYTGYNYNASYIGGFYGKFTVNSVTHDNIVRSAKVTDVKKPSECAIFGDGQYSDGANKFMRAPFAGPIDLASGFASGSWAGTQGFRHLRQTNVAWCDGSATSLKQRYTVTEDPMDARMIAPGTGFLSPDNSAYDLE
jgi:prepilin-type N-terminal cleavage/methylation domain-containing protein/prepilin-type processing-associated H-X9-DG protein